MVVQVLIARFVEHCKTFVFPAVSPVAVKMNLPSLKFRIGQGNWGFHDHGPDKIGRDTRNERRYRYVFLMCRMCVNRATETIDYDEETVRVTRGVARDKRRSD